MRFITLDRLDQVGNQIGTPLKLDINVGPTAICLITQADQAVKDEYRPKCEHDQHSNSDNDSGHVNHSSIKRLTAASLSDSTDQGSQVTKAMRTRAAEGTAAVIASPVAGAQRSLTSQRMR